MNKIFSWKNFIGRIVPVDKFAVWHESHKDLIQKWQIREILSRLINSLQLFTVFVLQVCHLLWKIFFNFSEFDIDIGNTLSCTVPKDVSFVHYIGDKNLADLCLPDGAHIYEEDSTFIFLKQQTLQDIQESYSKTGTKKTLYRRRSILGYNEKKKLPALYGMVLFKNKKDSSVRRGAIQKSIVLFSYKPLFKLYEPMLRLALNRWDVNFYFIDVL